MRTATVPLCMLLPRAHTRCCVTLEHTRCCVTCTAPRAHTVAPDAPRWVLPPSSLPPPSQGYPAAEMKHGPIALIDPFMPVVFIASKSDPNYRKIVNNVQEVLSRKGSIIVVTEEVRVRTHATLLAPHTRLCAEQRGLRRHRGSRAAHPRDARAHHAHPRCGAPTVARLPHRRHPRLRHRPAAQPCEERDRRVTWDAPCLPWSHLSWQHCLRGEPFRATQVSSIPQAFRCAPLTHRRLSDLLLWCIPHCFPLVRGTAT